MKRNVRDSCKRPSEYSCMKWRLVERRNIWWPTRFGWACLLLPTVASLLGWCICGEAFLSPTVRLPAALLVVEGWAGRDSLPAALQEFQTGGYRLLVTSPKTSALGRGGRRSDQFG